MDKNEHGTAAPEKNEHTGATAKKNGHTRVALKKNGHTNGFVHGASAELRLVLSSLQAVRDGNFSVRLPGDWTGLEGKIADTFNEIVAANQKMARELKRVGQVVGKEGKTRERARF